MVKITNYLEFKREVIDGGISCALFITKKDCPVCAAVRPKFYNISDEYTTFPFYEIDIYDASPLLMEQNLKSVPQVFFFNQGSFHRNVSGDTSEDDLALKVEYLLYYK